MSSFRVTTEVRHAHVTNVELELEDLESFRSEGQRTGRERELCFERFGDFFIFLYYLRHSKIYPVITNKLGYGSFGSRPGSFYID